MKKLAVVFGVAAVATITGCRDLDYDAKRGKNVQDEAKSVETTPAAPEKQEVTPAPAPAKTQEIVAVETKCTCAPGTTHDAPCACGASDCKCKVVVPEVKPLPPAPAEEYTVYIVQNGDFLSKISKKYNVTINSIKRLNNMKSDSIRVGQKLKLPGKIDVGVQTAPAKATTVKHGPKGAAAKPAGAKGFTPYTGATKEYVVKNGDTLGSVAYGNGINIRQLKQLNNLTSDSLKIGQKLKVPADAKAAKAAAGQKKAAPQPGVAVKQEATTGGAEKAPAPVAADATAEAKVNEAEAALKATAVEDAKPADTPADAAGAASAAPVETKSAPATTTYVVQEGENIMRLAVDFGVSTSVIRELNNLGENDDVKPGQVLKLPAESQQ